jgi:hypothetical protein
LVLQRDPNILFSSFCTLVFPSIGVILILDLPKKRFVPNILARLSITGSHDDSAAH